jgi:hypothetical protein
MKQAFRIPFAALLAAIAGVACDGGGATDEGLPLVAVEQPGTASSGGNPTRSAVRFVADPPAVEAPLLWSMPTLQLDSVELLVDTGAGCAEGASHVLPIGATIPFDGAARLSVAPVALCSVFLRGDGETPLLTTAVTLPSGRVVPLAFGRRADALVTFSDTVGVALETGLFVWSAPLLLLAGIDAPALLDQAPPGGVDDALVPAIAENVAGAIRIFADSDADGLLDDPERTPVARVVGVPR